MRSRGWTRASPISRRVLDAAGAARVAVASASESGPLAIAFAAAHPDRARGLALYACRARYGAPLPDYPFGYGEEELLPWLDQLHEGWGTRAFAQEFYDWMAPSLAADPVAVDWLTRLMPASADPRHGRRVDPADLRDRRALGAPVDPLSEHRVRPSRRRAVPVRRGRVARRPHRRALASSPLDGADHPFWAGDTSVLLDELESFVTALGP